MIFQVVRFGSFFDVGVKNPATAFSSKNSGRRRKYHCRINSLVVVDSIFRLTGGGETESLSASRFILYVVVAVKGHTVREPQMYNR